MSPASGDDEWTRPMLRVMKDQLRAFEQHCATCLECRETVIAAWSVSADVTDTFSGLCFDGMVLVGAKLMMSETPTGGASA